VPKTSAPARPPAPGGAAPRTPSDPVRAKTAGHGQPLCECTAATRPALPGHPHAVMSPQSVAHSTRTADSLSCTCTRFWVPALQPPAPAPAPPQLEALGAGS
jgi:hypothetical protein